MTAKTRLHPAPRTPRTLCLLLLGAATLAIPCLAAPGLGATPSTAPAIPASRPIDAADRSLEQIMSVYGHNELQYPPAIPFNTTSPRTTQLLIDALHRDKTTFGQAQLLIEIGKTQHAPGAAAIQPFLTHADPLLRAAAARAAGTLGEASLAADVQKLLADDQPTVRRAALDAALKLAKTDADKAALVERGLGDADPAVLLAAIHHALPANAATLAAKLPGFAAPLQIQTLRALGRIKASAQAAAIAPFLKSAIPLRAAAIQSLGEIGATDQAPAVLALLKDPHPTVRREAMDAIAHLADPATQQQRALAGLADPDPTVRQAAARIFKPHPLPEAVDPLVKQLYDPYLPLHDDARQSLTTYTTPAMREQIIAAAVKLLHESNPRRQEDGSFLLGAMKSEADLDFHIGLLTFRKPGDALDWDLYTQAIWSLTQIGNPKAAPPLLPLLKNVPATQGDLLGPKGTVSTVAGEAGFVAAAKFGLKAALPEVNRVLRGNPLEQSADMRAAAVWALGALMPAADHATNQRLLQIAQNTSGVDPARTEAIKCLILRKAPDLLDALQQLNQTDNSPMVRFTAHWACEHLTGQSIPYTPPNAPFKATTSIEDLAAQK